jgi:hypothetical protein
VLVGLRVWLFSIGMPGALPAHCADSPEKKEEQKVITGFRDAIDSCDHRLFSGSSRPTSSRVLGE